MIHDDNIWSIIGIGKDSFCSFKVKTADNAVALCRNPYNLTGTCTRLFCPLANSQYPTVLEHEGKLYLYMKTAERAHTPLHLWEKVELPSDFRKALQLIDERLMWWETAHRLKCKQRAVRLTQMLIRRRRMELQDDGTELVRIHKKEERRLRARERKADSAANVERAIRDELLNRLRSGAYDSIMNVDESVFQSLLEEEEALEHRKQMEELENVEEEEAHFIADYDNMEDDSDMEDMMMSSVPVSKTSSVTSSLTRAKRQRVVVREELEMEDESAPVKQVQLNRGSR